MTCELFVTDNANTPQNRYITSLYYNLMSARVFRDAFKPGIPKEIAYNFTTTIAHAVVDSAKCSTYNKMTLERFYHNALLFLHPKNETKDFACTIALTTALVCYEPKLERNASLIATFISNAICKSLQNVFLKTSFQPNIMEIT
ncbi:uncharacterized protein CEXT_121471 [Caerostris extrusa]|uniref:Uncharacterized protein n=1 Tax=Caerostris extrusa TaxID=172846 RepID=A0AAV4RNX1_CAEEX|nr:uncharacterized protein CEXT_121471 [Caerostris extrusa]